MVDTSLSVVVPVFNEEECLPELLRRLIGLRKLFEDGTPIEFIFVDDGSTDESLRILLDQADVDESFKVVSFSRNFGHQIAVTAGLDYATGDIVAIIDADLQDPPELIATLYSKIKEGYDVVYGQRRSRTGERWLKKATAAGFYRVMEFLCDVPIPRDAGDFRVITRRVAQALKQMPEKHRFIRGMVPWAGYKSAAILYDRDVRYAGETKYPMYKMFVFATDAILSFSNKPLQLAARLGMLIIGLAVVGIFYMLYIKLFTSLSVPGITVTVVTILGIGGVQILLIGLVGEYVARIFEQVKDRPLYFVSQTRNL